jgi:two-component system nitrate/nitrite response regulator NarL
VKPGELVDAIHALLSSKETLQEIGKSVDPTPSSIPGFTFAKEVPPTPECHDLTEQEKVILFLISQGLTNKSIENKLHISKNTLKTHIRNIFSKTGVSNRTQAGIWALQNGYGGNTIKNS